MTIMAVDVGVQGALTTTSVEFTAGKRAVSAHKHKTLKKKFLLGVIVVVGVQGFSRMQEGSSDGADGVRTSMRHMGSMSFLS